jgi:hypothetical protein
MFDAKQVRITLNKAVVSVMMGYSPSWSTTTE